MLSSWLPWLLAASMPVIALALRLLAGDDEPDNATSHEQPGGGEHDPGPAAVPALA